MTNSDGTGDVNEQDAANETEVRIRRAPKYPTFLILGGGVGAVVTYIVTSQYPADPQVGFAALFGYFALYGVTGGVLVGALLALLLDRIGTRRSRPATVVVTPLDDEEPRRPVDEEPAERDVPQADAAGDDSAGGQTRV